jgi:hypothetical protein
MRIIIFDAVDVWVYGHFGKGDVELDRWYGIGGSLWHGEMDFEEAGWNRDASSSHSNMRRR